VLGKVTKLIESKIFLFGALTALVFALTYAFSIADQPRMSDGALGFSEASAFEIAIIMLAPLSGITMWLLAIAHSFRAGRKAWGILTILAWPVAFLYAVMVNFVWCSEINRLPR